MRCGNSFLSLPKENVPKIQLNWNLKNSSCSYSAKDSPGLVCLCNSWCHFRSKLWLCEGLILCKKRPSNWRFALNRTRRQGDSGGCSCEHCCILSALCLLVFCLHGRGVSHKIHHVPTAVLEKWKAFQKGNNNSSETLLREMEMRNIHRRTDFNEYGCCVLSATPQHVLW